MAMTPPQLDAFMTSSITLKPFQQEYPVTVMNVEAVMNTVITESRKNFQTSEMSENKTNALVNALELIKTHDLQAVREQS